jgi:hypothetical protein
MIKLHRQSYAERNRDNIEHNSLLFRSETESQLYVMWDVSDSSSQPVLFDPDLGNFMVNTFVMELEYMFAQVS